LGLIVMVEFLGMMVYLGRVRETGYGVPAEVLA
jgi:hypothetical protein